MRFVSLVFICTLLFGFKCHAGDAFYSDYISFVGQDPSGHVSFAIDDDRWQSGKGHKVEIHVVLHDEIKGYVSVIGNGTYSEPGRSLAPLATSPDFNFIGNPGEGIQLSSQPNQISLNVKPIVARIGHRTKAGTIVIGSADATMRWQGRVLPGRVTYEYLIISKMPAWYSFFSGLMFNNFNGLYLLVGNNGDLYIHSSHKNSFSGIWADLLGGTFVAPDENNSPVSTDLNVQVPESTLPNLKFKTAKSSWSYGVFSWPTQWQAAWDVNSPEHSTTKAVLELHVVHHKTIKWWFIGGYSLDIVRGRLKINGLEYPVYGLAELII